MYDVINIKFHLLSGLLYHQKVLCVCVGCFEYVHNSDGYRYLLSGYHYLPLTIITFSDL